MKILLTGGTGFLGRRLLPLLHGHEVLCLTRDAGRLPRLQSVRPLIGDLMMEGGQWRAEVARFGPDGCLHLAWAGLPDYSLARCRANLDAGLRLLETLTEAGTKRITIAGSCWEYGQASGTVTEDRPGILCGLFAATKNALRAMVESLAREASFEYRWARVFFAYGPGQRTQSLIPLCHAAYAAGRKPEIRTPGQTQDFIHVDDVARGLWAVMRHDGGSGVFNLGSGTPTTAAAVVNQIAAHFGRPPPFSSLAPTPTPVPQPGAGFWADTTRVTRATGWKADIPLADGIARTLAALDSALQAGTPSNTLSDGER